MDANEKAHRDRLEYLKSLDQRRADAIEKATRDLAMALSNSEDVPPSVREAAERLVNMIDEPKP